MAVFQASDFDTKQTEYFLVQASANVQMRFRKCSDDGSIAKVPDNWTAVHQLVLGTITRNWRDYIKLIDGLIDDIVCSISSLFSF